MNEESISNNSDLEIQQTENELDDDELTPLKYDISVYPADYTIEVLHQKWKNGEIIIPKFQRGFVWTMKQSSKLIESFMMGLPIPPIFLYVQSDQTYLVIDGRQRLESIFYFLEGLFGPVDTTDKRRVFRLEGINIENRLSKKTFDDFDDSDKRQFKNSILRTIIVKQLQPNDSTSVYHIFERLNTGGTVLKDQEVRNCVYEGKLNDLLIELNNYPAWREVLGKPNKDSRQKDVELILRYMALFHNSAEYKKPMKDFLSMFMKKFQNPDDDFVMSEKNRFKKTCDLLLSSLGKRPFNPKGGLNNSVFDSMIIAFSKHIDSCPPDIQDRVLALRANEDFNNFISAATTDPEIVRSRLKLVEKILFE